MVGYWNMRCDRHADRCVPVGAEAVHGPVPVDTGCRGRIGGRQGVRGRAALFMDCADNLKKYFKNYKIKEINTDETNKSSL